METTHQWSSQLRKLNNDRRTQIVSSPLIQYNLRENVFEVKTPLYVFSEMQFIGQ